MSPNKLATATRRVESIWCWVWVEGAVGVVFMVQ
jgi:hypothetical protein